MNNDFTPPQQRAAWKRLQSLANPSLPHLRELLADPAGERQASLQLEVAGLQLDASRQQVTPEVMQALLELAAESRVLEQAQAQRQGLPVNATENRAVLHMALRGADMPDAPWGAEISDAVRQELDRFLDAAERIRDGRWRGHRGQRISNVINIGIGGSDLGPRMAVQALDAQASHEVRVHFVSNPDCWALHSLLRWCKPDSTLFIVQSKTFTTQETLTLANSAQRWLADHGLQTPEQQAQHLIAVTASPAVSAAQGYAPANTFGFWDWVGGRYSVWSAIGLPLAIAIGAKNFRDFLAGGHAMDRHFWEAPPEHNMPLRLALLGVWNRNFLDCPTHLIAAYASRLFHFARFLQQLDMESNGKSTHVDGSPVEIGTGPIVWGGLGIEGQHAYFQLLHQGQHRVPVDFIGVRSEDCPLPLAAEHHRVALLNLEAQAQALALGRDAAATEAELRASGLDEARIAELLPHRTFRGNVPNSTLWLAELTPHTLGAMVALYEHKVFCQAAIWGIHAYDQWGVELGKTMARQIEQQQLNAVSPAPN
ncbi:glucose-6-phosphate isomerase [Malikia spinosa]|uniref:Glucose-6-phosphate isomerase n=1 Tax=Malikia spinosa TaxID=86180 RepID=A0A2S9KHQ1_9BURK|nr:glucose-6-phosphate isomerase [Malikia spinosa]PRD69895.1 glucose-6-phosphate isomerase [Malikia spinosa]